jgi:hypothetical protein
MRIISQNFKKYEIYVSFVILAAISAVFCSQVIAAGQPSSASVSTITRQSRAKNFHKNPNANIIVHNPLAVRPAGKIIRRSSSDARLFHESK